MQRSSRRPTQILAIVLLPLLLAAAGAWEIGRGTATVAALAAEGARFPAQLARIQALAQRDPMATVRFTGDDRYYGAALAATMMADRFQALQTDVTVAQLRVPFAWLAAGAAVVSLAGGLLALALVSAAARRSLRSRDVLVQAFGRLRRVVPFALGSQVVGVAVALLGVVVFECGGLWFMDTLSAGEIKLVAVMLAVAGLALWGAWLSVRQLRRAFGLFRPSPATLLGMPVSETEAPGLFALVRELAHEQEAIMPQTVVAGALSGFFVTSYPQRLPATGGVVDGRTLHVSLPQLAVLSRAETRVVLAHELAHFSGSDTEYSVHFQPVYAGLQHSMAAVASRARGGHPVAVRMMRPAAALGEYVLDRFDLVVKHWSRLREFEADRNAVAAESADALATSLLRTAVTSEIVDAQLGAMAQHPDRAPEDLMQQMLAMAAGQGFIDPGRHLDERQPHPTDTHPPTVQRIEAAGVAIDDGLLARAARPVDAGERAAAEALFADWPGLCRAVTQQLRGVAVAREQAYVRQVKAAAAAVDEAPVELFERRGYILGVLGFLAVFCFGLAALLGWLLTAPDVDDADTTLAVGAAVCAVGGLAACLGLLRFARNRAPFLVLTAAGIASPAFTGTVPWEAVAGVTVAGGRGGHHRADAGAGPPPASADRTHLAVLDPTAAQRPGVLGPDAARHEGAGLSRPAGALPSRRHRACGAGRAGRRLNDAPAEEPAPALDRDLARTVVQAGTRRYFADRRALVQPFVDRHFSVRGTLALHRAALGWDFARAPANLSLAVPQIAMQLGAGAARAMGAARAASLLRRSIMLKTDVERRIEWLVHTELLGLPFRQRKCASERDALAETILSDPALEAAVAAALAEIGRHGDDPAFRARLHDAMTQYGTSRTAAAEITTGLLSLGAGALALNKLTPGAASLGPSLAAVMAQQSAVASFPLGGWLGGLWYAAFPAAPSALLLMSTTGGLMLAATAFAAVAGVVSDPIQRALGLHRARLMRMLDALEAQAFDGSAAGFAVHDHYVARLLDLFDLVGAALRLTRP